MTTLMKTGFCRRMTEAPAPAVAGFGGQGSGFGVQDVDEEVNIRKWVIIPEHSQDSATRTRTGGAR